VITFVLGGARSGKSAVAEALAASHGQPVTYVATMVTAGDPELEARVEAHRRRRPNEWATVEGGDDLPGVLRTLAGTVLVDSLGPWVAATLDGWVGADVDAEARADGLCAALRARKGDTVLVSDEVGLAVHPSSVEGRVFRDALGAVNRAVSAMADRAYLVVAGRPLELPPVGTPT
jgi:adenosyl cobinamide kinase/adenosyl cobinamide phosphate guanylyltransferase